MHGAHVGPISTLPARRIRGPTHLYAVRRRRTKAAAAPRSIDAIYESLSYVQAAMVSDATTAVRIFSVRFRLLNGEVTRYGCAGTNVSGINFAKLMNRLG